MHNLLIEDNRDIAQNMLDYFEAKGYALDLAENGISGLKLAISNPYDVIVLDLMLPGLDGLTLCRRLREAGKQTPVLMLTARDSLDDIIEGLEAGADDYVVKPFSLREINARLRALLRRTKRLPGTGPLRVGDLSFDPVSLKVTRGGRTLDLPPIPRKILETLMRQSPGILSREELERAIWGDSPPDSDALRAHLHILRNCVDKCSNNPLIKTVRGVGYQISAD